MNIEELAEILGGWHIKLEHCGGQWIAEVGTQEARGASPHDALTDALEKLREWAEKEVAKAEPYRKLLDRIDAAQAPKP